MKKFCVPFCLMLVLVLSCVVNCSAQMTLDQANAVVERTNNFIDNMVENTDHVITASGGANAAMMLDKLVEITTAAAKRAIDFLTSNGIEAVCIIEYRIVGGVEIAIDPIFIVGF